MNDPIVDEVRKVRDDHASRFNYDLDAIYRNIKEQEKKSGRTFVSFLARKAEPNESLYATGTTISTAQRSPSLDDTPGT